MKPTPTDPTEAAIYASAWGARAERLAHDGRGNAAPHLSAECLAVAEYAVDLYRLRYPQPAVTVHTVPVRVDAFEDLVKYAMDYNARGMRAVACRMFAGPCFCGAHRGAVMDGDPQPAPTGPRLTDGPTGAAGAM